ncbi:hypothetical protein [Neorhizobium sp. S3-V5DH]|uniref:hypothetical protein n=1 Tax=Neorhizobium sp. S3-V5DH TaxID=2485166 RepID=UPI00105237C5|nr:hypothetical protein [Neorhizobium sp. S3-V5DH]TCV60267.1 hypothetical protein EDE09_13027 [Neorhizobium sp. S3-V5DH]
MAIYNGALALLGKSEIDAAVVDYLKSLGATLPLKRPPRGEKETNVEVPGQQIELVFTLGSELPNGTRFAEGELVLRAFFALPEEAGRPIDGTPFDLDMTVTREQARAKSGEPEWSSRGSLKTIAGCWRQADASKLHVGRTAHPTSVGVAIVRVSGHANTSLIASSRS